METPQLPSNTTAERVILATIMLDSSYFFLNEINEDWFYTKDNRDVFVFCRDTIFSQKEIESVGFAKEFGGRDIDYYDIVSAAIVLPSQETYL